MIAPDFSTLFNSVALLVIAIAQKMSSKRERRNQKATHKQIEEVSHKQDKIVEAIGPVAALLQELALAREQVANLSNRDTDILSAVEARKRFKSHEEFEAMKHNIKQAEISKFKAEKDKPHPPFIPIVFLLGLLSCVGCANMLAPRTKLSAGPVTWQNPKNMTAEGIEIEYGTNGTMKASIRKISTVMDPQVIAVSGDALSKLIQTAVEAGSAAAAKAK